MSFKKRPVFFIVFTLLNLLIGLPSQAELTCTKLIEDSLNENSLPWQNARKPVSNIDDIIAQIPALGHLTTLDRLLQIGRSKKLVSRDISKQSPNGGRDDIKGNGRSVYTKPLFGGISIGASNELKGPHIIINPSALRRIDYFYSLGNWNNYGTFNAERLDERGGYNNSSYAPHEWNIWLNKDNIYWISEIMFENEIKLKDYVSAIIVPKNFKHLFIAGSVLYGISWKKLGVKIIFSNRIPDIFELREINKNKDFFISEDPRYQEPHSLLKESIAYNLPDLASRILFLETPENRKSALGRALLDVFSEDGLFWKDLYDRESFSLILKTAKILKDEGIKNSYWIEYALSRATNPEMSKALYTISSDYR